MVTKWHPCFLMIALDSLKDSHQEVLDLPLLSCHVISEFMTALLSDRDSGPRCVINWGPPVLKNEAFVVLQMILGFHYFNIQLFWSVARNCPLVDIWWLYFNKLFYLRQNKHCFLLLVISLNYFKQISDIKQATSQSLAWLVLQSC